jgi:hypothetical protein
VASCTWIGISFSRFGKFYAIFLLSILHIPLSCTSFLSLMPIIHRFGLLMESQSSCIFLSQLLSFCLSSLLFLFFNIYFVFEPWYSVFHLFKSAGVVFNCVIYLI